MNRYVIFATLFFLSSASFAQLPWPSISWSNALNLTSIADSNGVSELSGLHWNPVKNELFGVSDIGKLIVLLLDSTTNTFSLVANKTLTGGPEGITQLNYNDNEFYVVDENSYHIQKYNFNANFSTLNLTNQWNLLLPSSTMTNTGNTGPEGIVFIPDSNLSASGFISQQTGAAYTSTKGCGGLFFIAHQNGGYIWVFDINPNLDDDFAFVGKYKTNDVESCDLSFDRSTNVLYILHNITPDNTLETASISSIIVSGTQRKFVTLNQYFIPVPIGNNDNIEGFAMTPKCLQNEDGNITAWLCRDVSTSSGTSLLNDAIRQFSPFIAEGSCVPLAVSEVDKNLFSIYPNPAHNSIMIKSLNLIKINSVQIINNLGQVVIYEVTNSNNDINIDVSGLSNDLYFVKINFDKGVNNYKFLKN